MSHHMPYYAQAPLGQAPVAPASPPAAPSSSTAMTLSSSPAITLYRVAGMAAMGALAYHGFRRGGSWGWALAWGIIGGLVWPLSLGVALAQGFAKPARLTRNGRRNRRSR